MAQSVLLCVFACKPKPNLENQEKSGPSDTVRMDDGVNTRSLRICVVTELELLYLRYIGELTSKRCRRVRVYNLRMMNDVMNT